MVGRLQSYTFYNAINNALTNESINKALAENGYDEAKLRKGLKMHEKASELYMQQFREKGEQFAATDDVNKAREKLNEVYIRHLKFARIAFRKDRGLYQELQMAGKRNLTHTGYLAQVEAFYTNVLTNREALRD